MQQNEAATSPHSYHLTYAAVALGVIWLFAGLDAVTARYIGSAWLWGIAVPATAAALLFPQQLRDDIGSFIRFLVRLAGTTIRAMRQPTSAF